MKGTSICKRDAVCGNGIVESGEECDNGNKIGCSFNCKIDQGFKCTSTLGFPSVCSFCGNGILEPGEECDNSNGLGCSKDCKIDPGFACRRLVSSYCYKKDPVCGNGLSEVGESCDDGNKISGDGCSTTCLIEADYTCNGEPSKCMKKPIN